MSGTYSAGELVWFITGTSSGFGHALVRAALARGDSLEAQGFPASPRLHLMQLDVTEGAASLRAKLADAAAAFGRIDVVVNNAGNCVMGFCEEDGSEAMRRQFETNVFGQLDVTNAALPYLRERGSGTIIYTGSRSSWKPEAPGLGERSADDTQEKKNLNVLTGYYASSKAALRVLAEAMNTELAQFNIRTLILEPGLFLTNSFKAGLDRPNPMAGYNELAVNTKAGLDALRGRLSGDPAKAMELVVDVVRGEGKAAGKEWPLYLPLGKSGDDAVREKAKKMLNVVDEWGPIIRALEIDN